MSVTIEQIERDASELDRLSEVEIPATLSWQKISAINTAVRLRSEDK